MTGTMLRFFGGKAQADMRFRRTKKKFMCYFCQALVTEWARLNHRRSYIKTGNTLPVDSSFVTLSADQIAGLFLISDGLYCCLFPESDDLAQLFDGKILLQPGCDVTTEPLASGTPGYFVKKPGKSHVAESY